MHHNHIWKTQVFTRCKFDELSTEHNFLHYIQFKARGLQPLAISFYKHSRVGAVQKLRNADFGHFLTRFPPI